MLHRYGTFSGGIDLPEDKAATLEAPIMPAFRPARLRVPLALLEGPPARAVVSPGQCVARGERLATADEADQVDVYAPLAGRVAGTCQVMLPGHPTGWRSSPAIELIELDEPGGLLPLPSRYDWLAADGHSIRARIAEGGLMTFRPPVASLSRWIDDAGRAAADVLIANVMENYPFLTADHRLLVECGSEVVRGLVILARAIGATTVILAVDRRRTDAYRDAVAPARLYAIETVALAHKYPTGADAMLVEILTRRETPPGGTSLDVGVAVTDAATCWAAYRWVACGQPATARVATVAGPRVGVTGNLVLPFGIDLGELLAACGTRPDEPNVHGAAMTGQQIIPGAVASSLTSAVLALEEPPAGSPTPCIRCGWCSGHCPARLNVAVLNDDFELGRVHRARRRGAPACIDCGICSYVCPARLPLARRLLLLKQAIRQRQGNA